MTVGVFAAKNDLAPLTVIGGLARSRPSCVSWGGARADCFYRGNNSAVFQQTVKHGKASAPLSIGGTAHKDVQCVTMGENKIDCIISDKGTGLVTASWKGETWSDWVSRTGDRINEVGRSSCTRRDAEIFNCLLRVPQDYPARIGINQGKFSGFRRLGGTYHSPFTCVSRTANRIDCYAACYNNQLCSIQWRAPRWSGNIRVGSGTYISSEPTSVASSETQNHVFSTTENNRMVHVVLTEGSGFSSPNTVGELPIIESPECVAHGTQDIYCFALGFDHYLYKTHYGGSNWSDWELLGGAFLESPSCVLYDTNQIYCFARSFKSSLVQIVYNIET